MKQNFTNGSWTKLLPMLCVAPCALGQVILDVKDIVPSVPLSVQTSLESQLAIEVTALPAGGGSLQLQFNFDFATGIDGIITMIVFELNTDALANPALTDSGDGVSFEADNTVNFQEGNELSPHFSVTYGWVTDRQGGLETGVDDGGTEWARITYDLDPTKLTAVDTLRIGLHVQSITAPEASVSQQSESFVTGGGAVVTVATLVPEPREYAMLAGIALFGLGAYRRVRRLMGT